MTITVATNNARIRYTATSGQTAFAIPFEFFENDEIYVYVAATTLVAADERTQGTGSTHYAVSGGGGSTGTVTFVTGITESHIVTIVRDIPIERITDFTAGSTINRAALNTQLDTLTAMVGDLKDKSDRAIRLQPYDSEISLFLPTITNRAGKIFGFDTNGNLTADTAANFDITLDDLVMNTITMSGNANSKVNLTAVLDSQIVTNGAVLNLKSTKSSNTADIKLDGSATYGIDLNAGNKAIRLQDATLFSSTIESSGAATLSSVVTSSITSTGDVAIDAAGDITLDADGGEIYFKDDGALRLTFQVSAVAATLNSASDFNLNSANDIALKPAGGQVDILGTSGEQRILFDNAANPTMKYFQNSNTTTLGVVNPTGTRALLLPDASDTLVGKDTTDTLTNKTLTSPTITGSLDMSDVNITNVGSISLDKITNDGGAGITLDSSAGIVLDASSGQIVFKDDNSTRLTVAINNSASQSITSLADLTLVSGDDTFIKPTGGQVYIQTSAGADNFQFNVAASPTLGIHQNSNVTNLGLVDPTATRTILFPDASDTLVGKATTDTLTNKTLTAPTLTGTTVVASLDISGDIDVDGTTNLDVVDIDGAVDMASTLAVGGALKVTGQNVSHSTNALVLGQEGSGVAQLRAYGPDGTTNGQIQFTVSANDGSPSIVGMIIDSSGQIIAGPFGGAGNAVIAGSSSPSYTNQAGTNLLLKSGDGSGTGSSFMSFSTSPAGSSGTTVNTATERMRIDSSGRLLLGTTSTYFADADDLVIAGSGNQGITIASGTSNAGNIFFADGTSGDDRFRGIVRYDHSGNNMLFYTNGANERMRIDSSGKLRVGGSSSTMSNTLNVESTGFTLMGLKRTSGVTTGTGELAVHMETNSQTTVSFDDEGSFVFGTASTPSTAAGFSEKVRIDSSGNIKTTGGGKFVAGLGSGFATDADITLGSTAPAIFFHDTSSSAANAAIKVDSGVISFLNGSTGTNVSDLSERMRIDSSGNVLIGTNNNSQAVGTGLKSVLSNSNARHFVVGADASSGEAYSLYAEGAYRFYVSYSGAINSTSTSISSISDERLKENIVDLETGLTEIMALKPRRFDWKNGDGKNIAGFIAQEVETVLPDLIGGFKHDELDDAKALKMGDVIPTLVNAIQEQQTLIKTLTDRVTALES